MLVCLCYHVGKNKIEPWWSTCNLVMIFRVYNHYQMFLHINSGDIRSLALDFDIRDETSYKFGEHTYKNK